MTARETALRWLPATLWMGFISYWSHQPALPIDQEPASRELLHVLSHLGAFAVQTLLNRRALGAAPRAGLWAFVLASAFGALDEAHQALIPGRQAGPDDWFVDTLAAALTSASLGASPAARWRLRL